MHNFKHLRSSVWLAMATASLCPIAALAQVKPAAERPAALNRLQFLEGHWKWSGSVATPSGKARVEFSSQCQWTSRFMLCQQEGAGEWPGLELYSFNDRKSRYEGAFTDGGGQVVAHPLRWDGGRLIAEYEYHVGGAYHLVRRTLVPKDGRTFQSIVEDLADEKPQLVFDLTATRVDK